MQIYPPNLKSVALPVPEIRGVDKLQTPNLEEGDAIGGRGWYYSNDSWSVPIIPPYILYLYLSISTRLPEILDCSFQRGLLTPILGKGRP